MPSVLIVSKTRMKSGICVSGLTASNRSIRLIPQGRFNQSGNTPYEIGQVWEINFSEASDIEPPHVEDVIVTSQRYVKSIPNLRTVLLQRVQPWEGGLQSLFDQMITIDKNKGYISRSGPIPNCSTGYWLPNKPLILNNINEKPSYQIDCGTFHPQIITIPFVGLNTPIERIAPGTLVRVSLARWFQPQSALEDRCYLQISGWYH